MSCWSLPFSFHETSQAAVHICHRLRRHSASIAASSPVLGSTARTALRHGPSSAPQRLDRCFLAGPGLHSASIAVEPASSFLAPMSEKTFLRSQGCTSERPSRPSFSAATLLDRSAPQRFLIGPGLHNASIAVEPSSRGAALPPPAGERTGSPTASFAVAASATARRRADGLSNCVLRGGCRPPHAGELTGSPTASFAVAVDHRTQEN